MLRPYVPAPTCLKHSPVNPIASYHIVSKNMTMSWFQKDRLSIILIINKKKIFEHDITDTTSSREVSFNECLNLRSKIMYAWITSWQWMGKRNLWIFLIPYFTRTETMNKIILVYQFAEHQTRLKKHKIIN